VAYLGPVVHALDATTQFLSDGSPCQYTPHPHALTAGTPTLVATFGLLDMAFKNAPSANQTGSN
jgi:hypothetical protein